MSKTRPSTFSAAARAVRFSSPFHDEPDTASNLKERGPPTAQCILYIILRSASKIIKGDKPSNYSYKGDSGDSVDCFHCPHRTSPIHHHQHVMGPDTTILRTALLPEARKNFDIAAEIYGKDKMKR